MEVLEEIKVVNYEEANLVDQAEDDQTVQDGAVDIAFQNAYIPSEKMRN